MNYPVIVITGASAGIGKSLAEVFARAGYPLGLIARQIKPIQAFNLSNVFCVAADVSKYSEFKEALEKIENSLGPIDCLINNAGFAKGGDFNTLTPEEHATTLEVNLLGVIHGMQCMLPQMQARKKGTIINISSVADRKSRPTFASYAAAKAGVKSLSESLRQANAKFNIRICNVAPALVLTPMLIREKISPENTIAVEDFAKTILWIYEQPQSICIRDMVVAPTFYEA